MQPSWPRPGSSSAPFPSYKEGYIPEKFQVHKHSFKKKKKKRKKERKKKKTKRVNWEGLLGFALGWKRKANRVSLRAQLSPGRIGRGQEEAFICSRSKNNKMLHCHGGESLKSLGPHLLTCPTLRNPKGLCPLALAVK